MAQQEPARDEQALEYAACDGDTHRWPSDYQEGDTCNCGGWYVIASRSAGLIIERAPEVDAE